MFLNGLLLLPVINRNTLRKKIREPGIRGPFGDGGEGGARKRKGDPE